jgi:hypothetical protein
VVVTPGVLALLLSTFAPTVITSSSGTNGSAAPRRPPQHFKPEAQLLQTMLAAGFISDEEFLVLSDSR